MVLSGDVGSQQHLFWDDRQAFANEEVLSSACSEALVFRMMRFTLVQTLLEYSRA